MRLVWQVSTGANRRRSEGVILLPPINLLEDGLPHEVADSVEVVVAIDDPDEIIVVASLDPPGDGDLREDLLPRLR